MLLPQWLCNCILQAADCCEKNWKHFTLREFITDLKSSKKYLRAPDEWRLSAVAAVLESLKKDGRYRESIVHHRCLPPVEAVLETPDPPLAAPLEQALKRLGVRGLYSHQVRALDEVRRGRNVLVSTPTASGKTLIYNLPVLDARLGDSASRALYLFPLKALEQDQQRKLEELASLAGLSERVRCAIYDGDTSAHMRRKILADPPAVVLTNPDMLHMGILAFHPKWEEFFRNLRYVVVDELHTYRGIFGAHFASVLKRLRRICAHYGSNPSFIASSATVANPGEFASRLFNLPFEVVDVSGAPMAGRHFLFVNPRDIKPSSLSGRLIREFVEAGLKTITFTKSRKATELIHSSVLRSDRRLAGRISSYRSGYLPSERREIENALAEDRLDAVISTSALEMGIDIGGLDACILVGYPGTVAGTWQRGGRVGRSGRESAIVLIAQQDALDQYFMRHPEDFFQRSCERALVDPDNEFVLADHLECAAAELPLEREEPFLDTENTAKVLEDLKVRGRLLEDMSGRLVASRLRPHADVNLRMTGESFSIIDTSGEHPVTVGTVGGGRALAECHPGAVYLHRARQYVVRELDLKKRNVLVGPSNDPYYTQVMQEKETEILETLKSKPAGNFLIRYGRLKVTEKITGYQKRSLPKQELLSAHPLDLPPQVFESMGFWIEVPSGIEYAVDEAGGHFMGGLHSIEHAAISLFPLFVLSDRNDIGGICFTFHPQVGGPAVFIYDGYPGGVGIALGGYNSIEALLEATSRLIGECPCESGCPSCVHSPKCGSGNKPLDKPSALLALDILLGRKPIPEVPERRKVRSEAPEPDKTDTATRGGLFPTDRKIYVFDLETQRSAEEVGGWGNKRLMRVSAAVLQDLATGELLTFTEQGMESLIETLSGADLIVGFNLIDFDYQVLSAYGPLNAKSWPTFDILADIHKRLGYRISLDNLAQCTLGEGKSSDGLEAIRWFKEGKIEKIIDYCARDVLLTARLFEHGLRERRLMFDHRGAGRVRLNLDWDIGQMLAGRQ